MVRQVGHYNVDAIISIDDDPLGGELNQYLGGPLAEQSALLRPTR
jgi:hypothetical protein